VGKTSIIANLATALTMVGKRVVVVDGNLNLANLDLLFGVRPQYTITDFLVGTCSLADSMVTTPGGISLLPAARGMQHLTTLDLQQKLLFLTELDAFAYEANLMLVDTASGLSDVATYFASAAHEIVVVITPEPTSLSGAYALIQELASTYREKRFWVVANTVEDQAEAKRLLEVLSRYALQCLNVSCELLGWIPRDPALMRAVAHCQRVVETAPQSPSARAITNIAQRLIHCAAETPRVKGGLQFFLPSLVAAASLEEKR
jgi:flagellar biosynthesis protein FlhG